METKTKSINFQDFLNQNGHLSVEEFNAKLEKEMEFIPSSYLATEQKRKRAVSKKAKRGEIDRGDYHDLTTGGVI